ncbi:MAG TPA: aminotransferase class I/II-fold pyridoxal phosphate-dependent enzyme [Pseudolabrys sp.]|nr:aminotransferase class I/II-fold pyridoxal phosphate-dependent enzyme [Pseudolabrys sp.]
MSKESALTGRARENLFSRVASMRKPEAQDKVEPVDLKLVGNRFTDFSTLPGYDELRLQRLVGEKLGLENPYFRMHESRITARTHIDGRELINFSCYDYLGLNGHPEVVAAAKEAIDRYGISASASRHVAGERPVHRSLERALAAHYNADDALVFVSGYATNVSVIGQLVGPKDLVISDAAVHNSAVMGSVLSGASRRSFAHNDLDNLEQILAGVRNKFERVLIVVEGLYSMDGDFPDLTRLIEIKKRFHAWLMIDEAHSLGVLGRRGYGLFEHYGVDPREVDIWMGTLSKTLAGCGGYIAGTALMVDYLRLMAGAFVYSVGMPPVVAASVEKALELMHREPERVARLQSNGQYFQAYAKKKGLDTGNGSGLAVIPIIVGESIATVMLSQELYKRGINVQPVLYPAVPVKSSRLRFFVTAMHTQEDIETAVDTIVEEMAKLPERLRLLRVPG